MGNKMGDVRIMEMLLVLFVILAITYLELKFLCKKESDSEEEWGCTMKPVYKCDYCDLVIDRDLNAAINLAKYKI